MVISPNQNKTHHKQLREGKSYVFSLKEVALQANFNITSSYTFVEINDTILKYIKYC